MSSLTELKRKDQVWLKEQRAASWGLSKERANKNQTKAKKTTVCVVFHSSGHRKHIPADGARNLYMILVLEYHTL